MRPTLAAAALVLLAGCGEQSPPRDAAKGEFCERFREVSAQTSWGKTQDAVADLRAVGTPGEITRDAREGFLAITEGAIAYRAGEIETAAALAARAENALRKSGRVAGANLAGALGVACVGPDHPRRAHRPAPR